jgi:hypothetical protein
VHLGLRGVHLDAPREQRELPLRHRLGLGLGSG